MKLCPCGNSIPCNMRIDGKVRNLSNRTKCLSCLPFQPNKPRKTLEERKTYNAFKNMRWYNSEKKRTGKDPINLRRIIRKSLIVRLLGGCCLLCGYDKCSRNLAFHHVHDKRRELSCTDFQCSLETLEPEIKKCVLICNNCHGEVHDNLVDERKILAAHSFVQDKMSILRNKQWSDFLSYEEDVSIMNKHCEYVCFCGSTAFGLRGEVESERPGVVSYQTDGLPRGWTKPAGCGNAIPPSWIWGIRDKAVCPECSQKDPDGWLRWVSDPVGVPSHLI